MPLEELARQRARIEALEASIREAAATLAALSSRVDDGDERDRAIARVSDDLRRAVHEAYAGGAGIGPRVLANEAADAERDRQIRRIDGGPGRPGGPPGDRFGVTLPSAAELGEYGAALRTWGARTLGVALGLVLLWKLATNDLVDSLQRLVWVFVPPETVEEVQDGHLPPSGLVAPPQDGPPPR